MLLLSWLLLLLLCAMCLSLPGSCVADMFVVMRPDRHCPLHSLQIHPALIAGIISRQSRAGTKINSRGYGQTDSNCYGLMQINKAYHAVKGGAFSEEHLDQGTTFLVQLIKTMKRTQPQWTNEQQLKGALACYISGEERVIPLAYEDVDSVTPNGDFASDVIARAQWFAENVFRT